VILVSSGAIAVGKKVMNIKPTDKEIPVKQACAAIGQARLMMIYQKLFAEYNHTTAQILMTKHTIVDDVNRRNAHNTFTELLKMGVIPVVNENDTVAVYSQLPVCFKCQGAGELVGPAIVTAEGGMTGTYLKTTGETGEAILTVKAGDLAPVQLRFEIRRAN
jgi:hypothetical protein